jgi:hypothetical protein
MSRNFPYIIIALFVSVVVFSGCKQTQYVPIYTNTTDSIYLTKYRTDTLRSIDSIVTYINGDTVRELRYKYIYSVRDKIDTIYKEHTDTIVKTVEVEKQLTKWQTLTQDVGKAAMILVLVAFVCFMAWVIYRIRRNRV